MGRIAKISTWSVMLSLLMSAAAWGGRVEFQITQRGGDSPFGSRDEFDDNQGDQLLLRMNNSMDSDLRDLVDAWYRSRNKLDVSAGVTGQIIDTGKPFLGVVDILATQHVIYLLWLDHGEMIWPRDKPLPLPPERKWIYPGYGSAMSSGGASQGLTVDGPFEDTNPVIDPPPTVLIPLPASGSLMLAMGWLGVNRRVRKPRPGNPKSDGLMRE